MEEGQEGDAHETPQPSHYPPSRLGSLALNVLAARWRLLLVIGVLLAAIVMGTHRLMHYLRQRRPFP